MSDTNGAVNPKESFGLSKVGLSVVPTQVLYHLALAMSEGAIKYGRHNYRVSRIIASIYTDAAKRHIDNWWEGRDIDPDSGLHEISKAIASLVVLYDSILSGTVVDDRPPIIVEAGWLEALTETLKRLKEQKIKELEAAGKTPPASVTQLDVMLDYINESSVKES